MGRQDRITGIASAVAAIALVGVLAAAPAAGGAPRASSTVALKADAGLGGLCRPGRWMPVRIRLTNDGDDVSGEVIVEWGDARLRRSVTLASPARVQLEVYVRTLDVRGSVSVRFEGPGLDPQAIDVPVRATGADDDVVVCVVAPGSQPDVQARCASTIGVDALPLSMRGLDAADAVVMASGVEAGLAPAQRAVFDGWRSARALETSGRLAGAPPPAAWENARRPTGMIAVGGAAYLGSVIVIGLATRRSRRRALTQYALVVALAGLGTAAAAFASRVGPWSMVHVRHVSALQQLTSGGSLLSMRGVIDYPAFDSYDIRSDAADLSLLERGRGASGPRIDADGYPDLVGVKGLGSRQAFVAEGVVDFSPLHVSSHEGIVRITNRSDSALTECTFPEGFTPQSIGTLAPGQTAEARSNQATDAPVFSCTLRDGPVTFSDQRHRVRTDGTSVLTVDLPRLAAETMGAR